MYLLQRNQISISPRVTGESRLDPRYGAGKKNVFPENLIDNCDAQGIKAIAIPD
jgi:hypothetical protein